jgi:Rrf2 family transcriptional regulator, nitric oxide-sensitive transcriptional repressor
MRLTTFTDYSLRVLVFVATAPEGQATIAEVARAYAISENHLGKVAHLLGREGFLVNTRGRGGGLRLARAPRDLSVGRLVRATEGDALPAECFDGRRPACVIAPVCRLGVVLARAMDAFYAVLDATTLQDIVANRDALESVLHGPLPRAMPA